MIEELKENMKKSYSPYSGFKVSSCLITKENKKYFGVNIENSSFGATICAERVSIAKAICEGETKETIKELHVLGSSENITMPCFICRQVFQEFFNDDVKIYVYNIKGDMKVYSKKEICPFPFVEELSKWKADL